MDRATSLYQLPFLISALVSLVVTVFMARRATHRGSGLIVYIGLSLVLWSTMNALEIGSSAPSDKVLWANVSYIGIVAVPVLWLLFALVYSGRSQAPSLRLTLLLAVVPVTTLLLLWTGPFHNLIGQYLRRGSDAAAGLIVQARGQWFVVHTVYSYALMLIGAALMVRILLRSPRLYRRQALALLLAGLLPLLGNAIYLLAPRAEVPIDLTPVSFTVSGVVVAFGVYRYGLLDIVPVARAAVVEGMRDGLLVVDAGNRVVDMNKVVEGILCRKRGECLGVPLSDILPAPPELLLTRDEEQEDIELPQVDGQRPRYEVRVSALYEAGERLVGRLAVLRDVTQQRRTEQEREALLREVEHRAQQLAALTTELTQAEERERRRLAQLLHDHLQQLLVGARLHVTAVHNQSRGSSTAPILQQVMGLLDQSLAASRTLTVELSPPVLHEGTLAQALAWLAGWVQEQHGLTVVTQLDPHAEPAGDDVRILLFQATRELLFNVVKHAHTERAYLAMRLVEGDRIELEVVDEGVGFAEPAIEDTQTAPGGFGLFSIRERLQLLGGRMEVESALQQGTRVTLYAPATPAPVHTREPERSTPVEADAQASDRDVRVLLVDDHRTVREGLAALLRGEEGIRVVGEATNGPMALELAARLRPDVVVMDVTLPGMSGIEATRRLRAALPLMRVVGLSAHAQPDIAQAMRSAGAEVYLNKGEPAETLIAAIRGNPAPHHPWEA